jgi:hypothetical protein
MYYNRTLSDAFSKLIEAGGDLRWLFDFVKNQEDLDFQIGRNNYREWISVYRGTTSIIKILHSKDLTKIKVEGAPSYKKMIPSLYSSKTIYDNFHKELEVIIRMIQGEPKFDKYYNNKKEGYYQNILSRKYGICGLPTDDFVIIDKEAVVGYKDEDEKAILMGPIQKKYKDLHKEISVSNPKLYGKYDGKKNTGNELDFLALDKNGNILLIEFKDRESPAGIYFSPMQIGMYYDIFCGLSKQSISKTVFEMLTQKQKIGLINPSWVRPPEIKEIIPVLIISEYNYNSSAKARFDEILGFIRARLGSRFLRNLRTFNFTGNSGLANW